MNKHIKLIVLLTLLTIPFIGNSQCKNFAKNICKTKLAPYLHDGVYSATILAEGESAELSKTFYSNQQYRIYICSDNVLPNIRFRLLDNEKNVLYDNLKDNYAKFYDFKLASSQQLTISIKAYSKNKSADKIVSGCVAVLVGFMNFEDSSN